VFKWGIVNASLMNCVYNWGMKDARLEMRIEIDQLNTLRRWAKRSGLSLAAFVWISLLKGSVELADRLNVRDGEVLRPGEYYQDNKLI